MPEATHCLPTGVLGTDQIAVPNVGTAYAQIGTPSSGTPKGVFVYFQGFGASGSMTGGINQTNPLFPVPSGARLDGTGGTGTVTYSNASSTIHDTNIQAGDAGKSVSPGNTPPGFNIPANATVGTVTAGTSFVLLVGGTPTAPSGSGTAVVINANQTSIFGQSGDGYALPQELLNDGWIWLQVCMPEFFQNPPNLSVQADITADPLHGGRYKLTSLLFWDHIVGYIYEKWGHTIPFIAGKIPIVSAGGSWGGWHSLQYAANRWQDLIGYHVAIPGTLISNASLTFTAAAGGVNFGPVSQTVSGITYPGIPKGTSGFDTTTNMLANTNIPGFMQCGKSDAVVGWSSTTYAGSSGVNVSTYATANTMTVADATQIVNAGQYNALVQMPTSTGTAWFYVTGATGTTLTLTLVSGTGTITNGARITQSQAQLIQAAAPAGKCTITNYSGTNHIMNLTMVADLMTFITGTIDPLI